MMILLRSFFVPSESSPRPSFLEFARIDQNLSPNISIKLEFEDVEAAFFALFLPTGRRRG
ncbi:hypothetical protein Lser_V15G19621 [Lactuca serriola]